MSLLLDCSSDLWKWRVEGKWESLSKLLMEVEFMIGDGDGDGDGRCEDEMSVYYGFRMIESLELQSGGVFYSLVYLEK